MDSWLQRDLTESHSRYLNHSWRQTQIVLELRHMTGKNLFVLNPRVHCPETTIVVFVFVYVNICVCDCSRLLDPVTGQEGLAQVLLGLLDAVLPGQSQRITQGLPFKYPFEGLVEKAILQSTSLLSDARLHLPATMG